MFNFPFRTTVNRKVAGTTAVPIVLTSAYVAGTIVSNDEGNMLAIDIIYIKGDETSMSIKVESTNETGALTSSNNWYQQVTQTTSGATVTVVPAEYLFTAASQPATAKLTILINPVKGTGFRISAKATGGTPTGTYAIEAYTGWV